MDLGNIFENDIEHRDTSVIKSKTEEIKKTTTKNGERSTDSRGFSIELLENASTGLIEIWKDIFNDV